MANFIDKIRDKIFEAEPLNENEIFGDEEPNVTGFDEPNEEPRSRKVVNIEQPKPNLTAVQGASSMKMILYQPLSYEDSQAIVDNLRARKPVIVNMVDLDREVAQRVLDFTAGAVYALNGTIRRVAFGIFVIVPSNVSIIGNGESEEKELFRT